ncbi:hypothetical protein [uncultured Nocardioides sp.]|uniref:hypothetical protein n=2 Tax=uncultured Nocardioides sp. TaxID=198441 RepID=UPI000C389EEF|nr:hypothetical protein [uncultured Nocardioides sp.]MAO79790.1 hypothetical protein [Nocardioides sp.]
MTPPPTAAGTSLGTHPVATPAQHAQELAALELVRHPVVRAAHAAVADTWLGRAKASPAMLDRFEAAFEEVMFSAAMWSSNSDPLHPQVTCITRLAHPVDGHRVPGSRWGIDNPDTVYRVVPISGDERYELRGRVGEGRMTENYFTLWNQHMGTVDVLDGRRMHVEPDGSFVATIDSDPAGDRPNHIRSDATAHELYVRDVLLDWERDDPNSFEVVRLGPAPSRPRWSLDEQAERTAAMMAHFADFTGKLSYGTYKLPPNHFSLAWSADHTGAMRSQVYVAGRFDLEPGQAFVIDVSDGGAEYFTVPLSNIWGTTLEIVDRTGSLNRAQSEPNPDGTWTYVLSPEDPGVHNWLDTDGLREGILTLRMAEFPEGGPRPDLAATGRVVDLADLDREVPHLRRLSPGERAEQLATRRAAYLRRLPEGPAEGGNR